MSLYVKPPNGPNWATYGTTSKPSSPLPRTPVSPQPGSPPYMPGSVAYRSIAVQAAPTPWTRFFFPEEVGTENTGGLNPLFHYFDVHMATELSAEELALAIHPPSWMPEAYQRLSFISMRGQGEDKTVAKDIAQGGLKLMRPGGEEHLAQVDRFCRLVARFRPRTWADTEPLVSLLSGLVLYLLGQLYNAAEVAAVKLKVEYDLKLRMIQDEEASRYSQLLAKERQFILSDYEQRLQIVKEEAAQKASEELGTLIRNAQLAAADSKEESSGIQMKLDEALNLLSKSRAHADELAAQLDEEKRTRDEYNKNLMEEQKQLKQHVGRLTSQVGFARKASIIGVRSAASEQEVWQRCAHALRQLTNATHTYCAELVSVEPGEDGEALAIAFAKPTVEETEPEAEATTLAGTQARVSGGGANSTADCRGAAVSDDIGSTQQFNFVAAGEGAEFMVGQVLHQHQGVSWALLDRQTPSLVVPDVSIDASVHFFQQPTGGMYAAAAVRKPDGALAGMVCFNAPTPSDPLEESAAEADHQFAVQLAVAASEMLTQLEQKKLEMLEAAALQMGEDSESVAEGDNIEELERYADLLGGRNTLMDASRDLLALKQVDVDKLTCLPDCGTSSWAVIRSVLNLVSDQPLQLDSWSELKKHINLDFTRKVARFNAEASGAGWPQVRSALEDCLNMKGADVAGQGPVVSALHKFAVGLKKVASGVALEYVLQDKLGKANKAVERAFIDSKTDALAELKSYRVAPKYSFKVLKAVFFCLGHTGNEIDTWGHCRGMISRGMIKKMVNLKPKKLAILKVREAKASVKGLTEEAVRKESMAALLLYKWLIVVLKVAVTHCSAKEAAAADAISS